MFRGALWPYDPVLTSLLQAWPSRRCELGTRLQSLAASGVSVKIVRTAAQAAVRTILTEPDDNLARDLARDLARYLGLDENDPAVLDALTIELAAFGRPAARATLAHLNEFPTPEVELLSVACRHSLAGQPGPLPTVPNLDPLWPALARHLSRQSTPADRKLLTQLAQNPDLREPPLSWGLRGIVRGDVWMPDGTILTLEELGVKGLPYLDEMPPELEVNWD